jgi:hypothetical protein
VVGLFVLFIVGRGDGVVLISVVVMMLELQRDVLMLLEDLVPSEDVHLYVCPKIRLDCLHRGLLACVASFILYVQRSEPLTEALLPASMT